MSATIQTTTPSPLLKAALWVAQALLAIAFVMIGLMKLTTPLDELVKTIPWALDFPPIFVRGIALIDIAGGLGILLPALTRIKPRLTVLAALGCVVLQILAIAFHLVRGEASVLPLNFLLISLSAFVLWGRARKAPILPRAA